MPHKQYLHRPTVIKDLKVIAAINVAFFMLFTQIDVLEWLYHFSRQYEGYELDELFPLGITIALSMLVFSYRRIVELGLMAKTLEQMSLVDPLTGLPNRRSGQISLISWCDLAEKKRENFAVYQIDLDDFKKVNDLYGQLVGDEVLKLVSTTLNNFLPKKSLLCRWLDDNFLAVVSTNAIDNPHQYAHQLHQLLVSKDSAHAIKLTACIGYKIWQQGHKVEDILHDTEDALMSAKHAGINQIKGN